MKLNLSGKVKNNMNTNDEKDVEVLNNVFKYKIYNYVTSQEIRKLSNTLLFLDITGTIYLYLCCRNLIK